jgi:hypothetical protein
MSLATFKVSVLHQLPCSALAHTNAALWHRNDNGPSTESVSGFCREPNFGGRNGAFLNADRALFASTLPSVWSGPVCPKIF